MEMDLYTYYLFVIVIAICGVIVLVGYIIERYRRYINDLQEEHREIVEKLKEAYSAEIDKLDKRLERIEKILRGE